MPIEVRRAEVLDAALRLIEAHGYEAVSMEAVAREADLAKPVVYNAYPGRGPLLRALLEREERRGLEALTAAMPAATTDHGPGGLLLAWMQSLAFVIAERPASWRLILIPPDETPEPVREHVQAGRAFALAQVRTLLGETATDTELATQCMLAAAEHAARMMIRNPEAYPPERLVSFARSLLPTLEHAEP
jgi:AcrR family transcriptional regulator